MSLLVSIKDVAFGALSNIILALFSLSSWCTFYNDNGYIEELV